MTDTEHILRFDHEWRVGDRAVAVQLAKEYVNQHRPALAEQLIKFTLDDMVKLIDQYREAGQHENRLIAEMWLLSEYKPQDITGEIHVTLPLTRALGGFQVVEE